MALYRLRRYCRAATTVFTLVVLLLHGCLTSTGPVDTTAQIPPGAKVDELLIVDCLLPGQIRQLGSGVTYVTPRRPEKLPARDCEIRGGEYVAFDRSNYATALKVWLESAKEGDPAAQTYVGEIFEKGLGVVPDYEAAADWYRRAAEKSFSRAAINLANLYDQGLGVPKDPKLAADWYRRAAGLPELSFDVAPSSNAGPEVRRLHSVVDELRREVQEKQREIKDLRGQLDRRQSDVESERIPLERERRELDARRKREQKLTEDLLVLERSVKEREARLASKKSEEASLLDSLYKLEVRYRVQQVTLERYRKLLAGHGPDIQLIEPTLVALRGERGVPVAITSKPAVRVSLKGRVDSVAEVRSVTINGLASKLQNGNQFDTEIQIKGPDDLVRIVAVDNANRRATLEFFVRSEPTASGTPSKAVGVAVSKRNFGAYHALVIGNDDYGGRFTRLQTAVNDATTVAQILRDLYGFKVTSLVNANRSQILSALNNLRAQLTEKDNLLVYYAGHGIVDKATQRGYWLPVDADSKNSTNWIANGAITDILNTMKVRQLLVVADTCYAGTLTHTALGELKVGISAEKRGELIQLMAQKRSRMVMTSGGVEPVLDSVGGKHSAFAQPFINLLRANAGALPGQELFQHLQLPVAAAAQRVRTQQAPRYAPMQHAGHESGDFIFVRVN